MCRSTWTWQSRNPQGYRDPEAAAGALRDHLSHIEHILERLRIDQPGILA